MKTLIFVPEEDEVSGIVELLEKDDRLKIKYDFKIKNINSDWMYKLYGLSAKKPFNPPFAVDTAELKSGYASSEREFTAAALFERGYLPYELDTFALVRKNPVTAEVKVAASCFSSLVWEVSGAFYKPHFEPIKSPVERGREILSAIKERTATPDPELKKIWLKRIDDGLNGFLKSKVSLSDRYEWYKIGDIRPPAPLPAYKHLLFVTPVTELFCENGFYLFGKGEDGHTALAVRTDGEINPFVNADDCAEKIDDYYAVGVYLGDDGQYFERIRRVAPAGDTRAEND